jgi:phage terminase small subunit
MHVDFKRIGLNIMKRKPLPEHLKEASMARPRTATQILELKGAFKKHPERKRDRANEPKHSDPFPKQAPKYLTDEQKKTWRQLVKQVPAGVLSGADITAVELPAILLAEFRTNPLDMPTSRIALMSTLLGKLGLNPSDRTKLSIPAPKKRNQFEDF